MRNHPKAPAIDQARLTGGSSRRCAAGVLTIFALGLAALYIAQGLPPRVVRPAPPHYQVSAREMTVPSGKPAVRGLGYMVPPVYPAVSGGTVRDAMRGAGLLQAYSEPPGRIAFTPEGKAVYLPAAPAPAGPGTARVVFRGNRDSRKVALTFDTSEVSEKRGARALIDELTKLRAPATFFVCGAWCYKNPDLLKLLYERGFEVANHSYDHPMFSRLSNAQITAQLKGTEVAVEKIAGRKIAAYCRTPYGEVDARISQVLADNGYTTVLWNTDTLDWVPATIQAQIRDRATAKPGGGDIILMHTTGKYTREAQIEIVSNLRALGFELTTVSGVLQNAPLGPGPTGAL